MQNSWFTVFLSTSLVIAVSFTAWQAYGQTEPKPISAEAIMEQVANRDLGNNSIATTVLQITDKKGRTKERIYQAYSQEIEGGRQNLSLVESPKRLLNTGFLSIDQRHDEPQDKQWIYLPALQRTKPIATKNKNGRFMASDFSYYDMTLLNNQQQSYQLLGQENVETLEKLQQPIRLTNSDKTNDPHTVWKISATPISDEVMKISGYASAQYWVQENPTLIVRAEYQTTNSNRKKIFTVSSMEKIDGIWVVTDSEMTSYYKDKLEQRSQLSIKEIQFDQVIPDNTFTVRRLEQGL